MAAATQKIKIKFESVPSKKLMGRFVVETEVPFDDNVEEHFGKLYFAALNGENYITDILDKLQNTNDGSITKNGN
jgi:hypothetical protein